MHLQRMNLHEWMIREGYLDQELASLVGSDRTTISRVRRGKVRPSWELIRKLKDASEGCVTANDFLDLPARETANAA